MLVSSLSEPPKNFLIYPNQHRKRKQNYLHSLGIFQVAVNSICYFFSHLVSAFNFFFEVLTCLSLESLVSLLKTQNKQFL